VERTNVLLVDDDDTIRSLLSIAISVEDHVGEIREASNGAEAVSIAADFHPDLVLLDHAMPVMDGRSAAEELRRMDPEVFIVAFSGALDAKPVWADEFCYKGGAFDFERVIDIVDRYSNR
jgi:CheY-like chemotaxis protein